MNRIGSRTTRFSRCACGNATEAINPMLPAPSTCDECQALEAAGILGSKTSDPYETDRAANAIGLCVALLGFSLIVYAIVVYANLLDGVHLWPLN